MEKDNGMHRCTDLPPSKFENIECTATLEDYFNYTKYANNDFKSGALIGLPSNLNHDIFSSSLINNQDQLLTTSYKTNSNFLLSSYSLISSASNSIINDSMSSMNNFNMLFKDNQTLNCINWNRYYSKCKAGDKNPFQGKY